MIWLRAFLPTSPSRGWKRSWTSSRTRTSVSFFSPYFPFAGMETVVRVLNYEDFFGLFSLLPLRGDGNPKTEISPRVSLSSFLPTSPSRGWKLLSRVKWLYLLTQGFSPYFPFAGMETIYVSGLPPPLASFLPTSPSRGWKHFGTRVTVLRFRFFPTYFHFSGMETV